MNLQELFGRKKRPALPAGFAKGEAAQDEGEEPALPAELAAVQAQLADLLGESPDIKQRALVVDKGLELLLVYAEGLSNPKHLLDW